MARLIGPDEASRKAETIDSSGRFAAKRSRPATVYADAAVTQLADILTLAGEPYEGSVVTIDAYSMLPLFQFPDGVDTLWVVVDNGPAWPIYARTDDRIDALGVRVAAIEPGGSAAAVTGEVLAADGSVGYSPLWKHARVSPSPLDRVPVIVPSLPSESTMVQEPQVWADSDAYHMIYTGGSVTASYLHYASCPIHADPLDPANWTKLGIVIGNGAGGEPGQAQHSGVYIESGTIYVYYTTDAGNIDVCTASTAAPTVFSHVGTVLTPPAGTSTPLANAHVLKLGTGSYVMYFEANTTFPLWQIGRATATSPTGTFGAAVVPLSGLAVNPGKSTSSNPFVVVEDGGYTMWFHAAWGENQRDTGSPTVAYMATSVDGIAWTLANNGYPIVRLAHPYEVDQVADMSLLDTAGLKYAFWSANTKYATQSDRVMRIMGSRVDRGLVENINGDLYARSLASGPEGPMLPTPFFATKKAAHLDTTTVGSDVAIPTLSFSQFTLPDTVRVNWGANVVVKSTVSGFVTVTAVVTAAKGIIGGQATVQGSLNIAANQIQTLSLTGVFTVQAGVQFSVDLYVKNTGVGATTSVFNSSSSWVDTRKIA